MRAVGRLFGVTLLLALAAVPPVWARVVRIGTTAPLADHSDQSIEVAINRAVGTCIRGATAMGLSWIRLSDAVVMTDKVAVQVVAGDEDFEDDEDVTVLDLAPSTEAS